MLCVWLFALYFVAFQVLLTPWECCCLTNSPREPGGAPRAGQFTLHGLVGAAPAIIPCRQPMNCKTIPFRAASPAAPTAWRASAGRRATGPCLPCRRRADSPAGSD